MRWPEIDFQRLRGVNERAFGWIRLEGTPIDYPVVHAPDPDYYLTHNICNRESVHGCIFALGGETFPDRRCALYGHAMKDGTMFVALHHYFFDDGFYETHRFIDFKTEAADYRIRVWASVLIPHTNAYMLRVPRDPEKFAVWRDTVRGLCPFTPESDPDAEDNIITLNTCRRIPPPDGERGTIMVVGVPEEAKQ